MQMYFDNSQLYHEPIANLAPPEGAKHTSRRGKHSIDYCESICLYASANDRGTALVSLVSDSFSLFVAITYLVCQAFTQQSSLKSIWNLKLGNGTKTSKD